MKEVNKGKVNRSKVTSAGKGHTSKTDRKNAAKVAQKAKREVEDSLSILSDGF